jgi:hypothetical protein
VDVGLARPGGVEKTSHAVKVAVWRAGFVKDAGSRLF